MMYVKFFTGLSKKEVSVVEKHLKSKEVSNMNKENFKNPELDTLEDEEDKERIVEEATVQKDTPGEVFFRMLAEEYPELELEIDEDIEEFDGHTKEDHLFVTTDLPQDSEKLRVVRSIRTHPSVNFILSNLIGEESKFDKGKRLEKEGKLPQGTAKRMMAFWCKRAIDFNEEKGHNVDRYRKKLYELGVDPMTEEEMREIFAEVIEEKLEELDE